ncbi:NAD-dependent epimerase/dehydratase family protein [Peterkaempfera sp. SMS 1(5)a]|uniref:NAD-dependent epimerase/dehydratase family protein n=1 Tax=Peterkaempfera podocarpi TaxID=3232308 RepID=UPI003671ACF4
MKVLVTGGAGFIGSRVAAQLAADGHEVRVLDALLPEVHRRGDAGPPLPAGVELLVGDVREPAIVAQALCGVQAVCHQAAMVGLGLDLDDAPSYVGCNDLGTAVLLAAMARAGVRSLVLAGSMVVYGEGRYRCTDHGEVTAAPRQVADLEAGLFEPRCPECGRPLQPELVQESAAPDPRNVYAATKVAQEHLAAVWARACGGRAISLRYHNVYGPGMPRDTPYAGVASIFRSALARGEAPRVYEDGGQRRDFVHVDDVAAANRAALERIEGGTGEAFRAYNVGSGEVRTVGEMARALARACGGPEPVVTGQYRLGDVRHVTASSQRLRSELGWRPEVSFADGMAEFAAVPQREAAAGPGLR